MQETNPRAGRAAAQALSHKKAAAELEVGAELPWAPSAALQRHLCPKAPQAELQISGSCVCFHPSPKLQHLRRLFEFKIWAVCSQTSSELCSENLGFYCFQKAQSESQEESKCKFKIHTHSPVALLRLGKFLLEERGSPSFSKTPTTTWGGEFFSPLGSSTNSLF